MHWRPPGQISFADVSIIMASHGELAMSSNRIISVEMGSPGFVILILMYSYYMFTVSDDCVSQRFFS